MVFHDQRGLTAGNLGATRRFPMAVCKAREVYLKIKPCLHLVAAYAGRLHAREASCKEAIALRWRLGLCDASVTPHDANVGTVAMLHEGARLLYHSSWLSLGAMTREWDVLGLAQGRTGP